MSERSRLGGTLDALERMGGMLVSPRATLSRLLSSEEGGFGGILVGLLAIAVVTEPERVGRALLVGRLDPFAGLQLLGTAVSGRLPAPVVGALAAAAVLALAARALRVELPYDRALDVAGHLLVPYVALVALGALAAQSGLEIGVSPHRPLRGSASLVALRALLGFGPSIALLGVALVELRRLAPARGRDPAGRADGGSETHDPSGP